MIVLHSRVVAPVASLLDPILTLAHVNSCSGADDVATDLKVKSLT